MALTHLVLGLDFGTDSVRTLLVDASNGKEVASSVYEYPWWKKGMYCDPARNKFRQHPLEYIEGLEKTIRDVVVMAGKSNAGNIRGIGVDTTGSTPVPVDHTGTPLSLVKGFEENPNAMFILWKDHTSNKEAEEINQAARTWGGKDFTKYEGGVYSSEWFWAKILHIIREDPAVMNSAYSWVEHCDWIPGLLTGNLDPLKMKRSRCAAGHKAMWHKEWKGLPPEEFLVKLDPRLKDLREKLYTETYTSDIPAGTITESWAKRLGLSPDVVVSVGTFDAHAGALGGEVKEFTLSKVMGTSTCDMLVTPLNTEGEKLVGGICGQVNGSIIPEMLGLEAGQSAFGDVYAWFRELLEWPLENIISKSKVINSSTREKLIHETRDKMIRILAEHAADIPIGESGIIALDWLNGRRTPYADQSLKGAITGLSLGSDAPRIFRALVEATCFGSRKIVDRFREEGVEIKQVIALGGVAKKSPFVMQVMADVLNMPIKVAKSEQTPALGAAMLAATAAGIYRNVQAAQKAMGNGFDKEYRPVKANVKAYNDLYHHYNLLGSVIEKNKV
ncbi:MAG TPA: ribulokinase [Cyclobacteriaceae bacterium]|nr:ribulokinase [Cyclobacteriaceae bacterium]